MKKLIVCVNQRVNPGLPSCGARGSEAIAMAIEKDIHDKQLPIELDRTLCLGRCENGPNLRLAPGGKFFYGVCLEDLPDIREEIKAFLNDKD